MIGVRKVSRFSPRFLVFAAAVAFAAGCAKSPEDRVAAEWSLLESYCEDCHNNAEFAGDLSLERFGPADIAAHPAVWEEVVRKLRGDLMPPPGVARPDAERIDALVAALEARLDELAAERGPMPGHVVMHRLNRAEYARAVEDLFGLKIDAQAMLPADVEAEGFDNIASALRVSPTHLDQYLAAARNISTMAVGSGGSEPVRAEYRSSLENHTRHVHGLPLGTRGGLLVEHFFPVDGVYEFNLNVSSEPGAELRAYPQGWLDHRHKVIMTIDGERVFEDELGGEEDLRAVDQRQIEAVGEIKDRFRKLRFPVTAGYHQIGATFVARSFAESDYELHSMIPGEGVPDVPRLLGMEIIGPYDASGAGPQTESRRRIFTCQPSTEAEETPCAEQILSDVARRAFRRPVGEADLVPLLEFYRAGREAGGFEEGIRRGLMAILASTKFLYRTEIRPAGVEHGEVYPVDDVELAWRLSFFLWSQGPDDELLRLAEEGRLSEPETYEAQIRRMLADPRSKALVTQFAFQWLSVRALKAIDPDPRLYPTFDEDLRRAFEREMELFVDSILRSDEHSVLDLIDARHTFVNERLARHYGIDGVLGDRFRRVELDDERRYGLFGKGSVLMATSYPDRTSPVLRGAWIMEHILGTPPAPVPPNVETDLAPALGDVPRSVRERLALHRTEPSCNHCHGVIDPLGQALENFDAIGEWRVIERDSGVQVDPTGQLANGTPIAGPADLRRALLAEPDQFVQALTEKLLTYALGRRLEYHDMPVVRRIVREAERDGYRFSSIVMGVARSAPFRMRAAPEPAAEPDDVTAAAAGSGTAGDRPGGRTGQTG
jgi:hypothetical protein